MLMGWAAISFSSALLVAGVIYFLDGWPSNMKSSLDSEFSVISFSMNFVGIVLVAPFVETVMLFGLFKFLSPISADHRFAAFLSAMLLASLHAIKWWGVAVIVFVPFLIFVRPFIDKDKTNRSAFISSMGMHSLHNLYASCLLLIGYFV